MPSHTTLRLIQAQNEFTSELMRAAGPNLSLSQRSRIQTAAHEVMMGVLMAEQQRIFDEVTVLTRTAGPSVAGEGGIIGPKLPPRPKLTGRVFS